MRGVFLDTDTVDRGDLDMSSIQRIGGIEWSFHGITDRADISARISGCSIVICNKVVLDHSIMQQAGQLKLIVVAATGTNNIDLAAARDNNIIVCNARDYSTPAVVQHVYALILALTVRLPQYMAAVGRGAWQKHPHFCFFDFPIRELRGLVMGIIGYGALGKGVAAVAPAFGLQIEICQTPGTPPRNGRVVPEWENQRSKNADASAMHRAPPRPCIEVNGR